MDAADQGRKRFDHCAGRLNFPAFIYCAGYTERLQFPVVEFQRQHFLLDFFFSLAWNERLFRCCCFFRSVEPFPFTLYTLRVCLLGMRQVGREGRGKSARCQRKRKFPGVGRVDGFDGQTISRPSTGFCWFVTFFISFFFLSQRVSW